MASAEREWRFRVLLDARQVGAHTFRVTERGGGERRVASDARFKVKFLFVDAYTYVHAARERWQDDCLEELDAHPAILRQPRLLNVQSGELTEVRIEPLGEETLRVRGAPLNARRYAVHAPKFRIDLWYAEANWVQLESRTDGGRLLRYEIE